jgi:hypothetical protein
VQQFALSGPATMHRATITTVKRCISGDDRNLFMLALIPSYPSLRQSSIGVQRTANWRVGVQYSSRETERFIFGPLAKQGETGGVFLRKMYNARRLRICSGAGFLL